MISQMVSQSEHGSSDHFPAGLLRVAGGQEVVGAVLQAALARQHRHLPQGPHPGTRCSHLLQIYIYYVYMYFG